MSKAANSYRRSLRAIGQGLEALSVEEFDLEAGNYHYVVHGDCKLIKTEEPPTPNLLKEAFLFLRRNSKTHSSTRTPVRKVLSSFQFTGLRITGRDIVRFERQGQAQSSDAPGDVNQQSISQTLRLAGTYLDHKRSRLLKLSWHNQSLTLWRRDGFGVESKEFFTPANLYDLWVHQYKQRKAVDGDPILKRASNN
ncbi:MAG: hypothetical protein ACREPG_13710 [Candidatus Binatia bacterium]